LSLEQISIHQNAIHAEPVTKACFFLFLWYPSAKLLYGYDSQC
jgi:hypothetical protein